MTLFEEATRAESIGNALARFRAPNPDYVQDVNAVIAESNFLGSALREIEKTLDEPDIRLEHIEDDLQLVHKGITFTLREVWRRIGDIGNGRTELIDYDYRQTWGEIVNYCRDTGPSNLNTRLQDLRLFLQAICKTLKRQHISQHEYAGLRHRVKQLDISPNSLPRLGIENGADDALVQTRPYKQQSFERVREAPLSPAGSDENRPRFPPNFFTAPTPPMSPPTTVSSVSQVSSNDGYSGEHWARAAFRDMSSTRLPQIPREDSKFHGPDQPSHDPPSARYVKALEMTFPPELGAVSLVYAPSRNMRAKMVVEVPATRRQMYTVCLPMDRLEISREGCMLRFCRPDGRHWVAWVSLNFTTIERLVLFANTFIAMRSFSGKDPQSPIWDDRGQDETEVFKAVCLSRRTKYFLSIYCDQPSNSIRLQASIRGSHLQGTPIWTAWITHSISSPTWLQQWDRKTVLLRDLHPHIFSHKDEIERVEDGSYLLSFDSSLDTRNFLTMIQELGRPNRRGR